VAVSADDVRRYLRAGASVSDADLGHALEVAGALLDRHIGSAEVPAAVRDQCAVEVAAEVYRGSATRAGAQGGQFDVAVPAPAPRADPLAVVLPKLRAWVVPF
jgi:hypothetical protein